MFAVGLEELQGLGVLSQEGVRGRLFAAGTGLGSASVPEVLKNLDKELANLMALRGQKQIVNLLIKQLKEIEARIRELQGLGRGHAEGQRRREHLEARVDANRQEAERRRRELGRVERLEQARVPWVNRNLAREKAVEVEYAQNFPVNGLAALAGLHKELDANRQSQDIRAGEDSYDLRSSWGHLTPDEAILAGQEAIEALVSEREKLAQALDDYPGAKARPWTRRRRNFGANCGSWGRPGMPPRLAEVDTSVQVRQRGGRVRPADAGGGARWRDGPGSGAGPGRGRHRGAQAGRRSRPTFTRPSGPVPHRPPGTGAGSRRQCPGCGPGCSSGRSWRRKLQGRVRARDEAGARAAALQGQLAAPAVTLPGWLGLLWVVVGIGLGLGGFFLWRRDYLAGG